jgi:hypothetical protein
MTFLRVYIKEGCMIFSKMRSKISVELLKETALKTLLQ